MDCQAERVIGFSRKWRGFCPSDLEYVDDGSPQFDLRIKLAYLSQDNGKKYPFRNIIDGNTRSDNARMSHLFRACGFVKEGYFREGRSVENGRRLDTVYFGILRRDWETGTTTTVPQNKFRMGH